jgi:glycosyltransferase involved in cell wall biosynthesis
MKAYIRFEPESKGNSFEGVRLRKNLKGALELNGVGWVPTPFASPDIAHFLSPADEALARDLSEDGLKIVVSALYCENDPDCRFTEVAKDGTMSLLRPAKRLLSAADLILVPTESAKAFLVGEGVAKRIEVLPAGVNLSRYERGDAVLESVFSRYVGFQGDAKYAFSVADYDTQSVIKSLNEIAAAAPSIRFYVAGIGRKKGRHGNFDRSHLNKKAPSNIRYLDILEDDVFLSAMLKMDMFLSVATSCPDCITSLEAMACKRQVFSLGPKPFEDEVRDGENGYVFADPEKCGKAMESYAQGKLKSTIIGGYRTAKAASLKATGLRLKSYYESLLSEGGNKDD